MRQFSDIPAFISFLRAGALATETARKAGLEAAGAMLEAAAKAEIGQELDVWPALADSTVADKERLGFTGQVSATDPLLRTGEMRDSITHEVDPKGVTIGSTSPIMLFQEFGTSRIPPRPVLALAMFTKGHAAAELAAGHEAAAAFGLPRPLKPRGNEN